ncbi:lipoprotein-anchoring transpeptidase ErfK/SrfK [Streptomyces sp. Amel2xB2]|uniref:L,D-transpeptidase n=1 Tax=Streptomyces sp. Amel2xB2 TaxID=1305829 RepID=UPI000DB9C6E3|nr:Ig-like domain-containing protein [Streptomyces sp. Amel2xB2]RAJ63338.1 lipoprotein-anchoring transpeptidase ErfK/SrfK [Streptomyces sp. Amel2xB2]
MDLKSVARVAKEKLNPEAIRGAVQSDGRVRLIGGSAVGLVVLAVVLLLTLTTCGGAGGAEGKEGDGKPEKSRAVVEISPKDGAKGVHPEDDLKVTASKGKLVKVDVENEDGDKVEGKLADGGRTWKPATHLTTKTKYTVKALAKDSDGLKATKRARFTTLTPGSTFVGRFTPEDGDTVGVGMPVSINFNHAIQDREAVEKAITVSADPEVDVEGHWFGDSRLDFRPEDYWKAGTKVELDLDLDGVEGYDGVYGEQDKSVDFTVGRSQVSVVDAKTKKMVVKRDGKKLRTVDISSGSAEHPTYNGRMVISERHKETRMDGDTVGFGRDEEAGGYDIKDVPHAMRLSTSGTFIHGNYWLTQQQFGSVNASHGCVGLFDKKGGGDKGTPGAWFFRESIVGDVVEIKNSKDETIQPDNGLNGWNMDWEKWKAPQK